MLEALVDDTHGLAAWDDDEWESLGEIPPVALSRIPASAGLAMELEFGIEDLEDLSPAELEEVVCAYERVVAWAQARQSQVLAVISRRAEADPRRQPYVVEEVATALHLSGGAAGKRLTHAVALDTHLAATRALWEQGLLCERRVAAIVDGTRNVSDEVAVVVQARVLGRAVEQTPAQVRAVVRRAVIAADPEGAQERHDTAKDERRVDLWPGEDGVATVAATVTAADGVAVYQSLTRLARGLGSADPRGMDARRADLLVGLCTGRVAIAVTDPSDQAVRADPGVHADCGAAGARTDRGAADTRADRGVTGGRGDRGVTGVRADRGAAGGRADRDAASGIAGGISAADGCADVVAPGGRGRAGVEVVRPVNQAKPLVHITIDSDTLTHRAQHPADLTGYGPITAHAAREIAADATWTRLVTDPQSGALLDHGRDTYRPSAALADFVRARDGSCMFPGCGRAARYCEVDHTEPFPHGPTTPENLYALCVRHHHLKHSGDWQVVALPGGGLEWTSPTGRVITTRSKDHRTDPPPIPDDDRPPF